MTGRLLSMAPHPVTPIAATVVVPARNEEAAIERCIERLAAQDLGAEHLEVLVVDGASQDDTAARARAALARHPFAGAEVVTNEAATTPSNLNAGLALARGPVLCRVDARSVVQPDHVRRCVEVLDATPDVAVVGGMQIAEPPAGSVTGRGIARALNNRFAMGLSRYRRGGPSGPSDTVYLGAFRTDDLRAVGGWDERLGTNQDFDLNRRMGAHGLVWFDADLRTGYVPRSSLRALWQQYVRFGRWKVRYWRTTGDRPRPRQVAILLGVPAAGLVGIAIAVRSGRPVTAALVGGSALLALDAVGGGGPAPASVRLAAAEATALVGLGWVGGAWAEILRPTDGGATR